MGSSSKESEGHYRFDRFQRFDKIVSYLVVTSELYESVFRQICQVRLNLCFHMRWLFSERLAILYSNICQ